MCIMYGMDMTTWCEKEIDKLDVGQNRVARMALNAPRYAFVEALRSDVGWSTLTLRYKVKLE